MNKPFSRLFDHRARRRKGDTAKLAAQLAPPEEQFRPAKTHVTSEHAGGATQEHGAIVVDNDNLHLDEIEETKHGKTILGMEPIVLAILIGMLLFIAFIAWQISEMPE